jgi:hypothetical protein
MTYSLDLSSQATRVMDSIEFNNIFFSKLFFLIIFTVYFSTNTILKVKSRKTIKGPRKKKHTQLVSELVKPINWVTWVSTSNL